MLSNENVWTAKTCRYSALPSLSEHILQRYVLVNPRYALFQLHDYFTVSICIEVNTRLSLQASTIPQLYILKAKNVVK